MIEVVNTTIEATTQENQVTEATINTMTLKTPEPTDLLQSLMKLLDEHIEKKVAEALTKHVEALRDIATEIAEEAVQTAMSDHTTEYDHDDYDDMSNGLDEKINDAIYDYDMDDKIKDSLSSALEDVDLEDKIKDAIRDMTFNVSVD
jgi:phosphoribosyl 1,2-cyclic phosphodiesterase